MEKPTVAGLYLGAGCGSRMGRNKLSIPLRETGSWLGAAALSAAAASRLDSLYVIVREEVAEGWRAEMAALSERERRLSEAAGQLASGVWSAEAAGQTASGAWSAEAAGQLASGGRPAEAAGQTAIGAGPAEAAGRLSLPRQRRRLVAAEEAAQGMSRSIRAGMEAALAERPDAVLVLLADQPLVSSAMIDRLILMFESDRSLDYTACFDGETLLPPVLLASSMFAGLTRLEGDQGARQLLKEPRWRSRAVAVREPWRLLDVDTEEDLLLLEAVLAARAMEPAIEPRV